ncbi:unnamed protein product, partial [Meganyctiphanes norvegica]
MQYADDFTQVIISKFPTTLTQAARDTHKINVEDEIQKQNDYENKWKIKTNLLKFTIINIGTYKAPIIVVQNTPIPYEIISLYTTSPPTPPTGAELPESRLIYAAFVHLKVF